MSRLIHEVKPLQARLVRSWETRLEVRVLSVVLCTPACCFSIPIASIAQLVEHALSKRKVCGSIPHRGFSVLNHTSGVVVT